MASASASASVAASTSVDVKKEKLSFAKIAAAGIKPSNAAQQPPSTNSSTTNKHDLNSSPRDGPTIVTPSVGLDRPLSTLKPKQLVQLASKETNTSPGSAHGIEVRVQTAEPTPQRAAGQVPEGLLMPGQTDDVVTQVSSSSGSNKPPSVDGKSVASGTTFALDEKDSLRPDDSASVKAVEDEDLYSLPGSGFPSRIGSDDGVRAFRDQLREISSMEPSRRGGPPQVYANTAPRRVLYVPPRDPGIGAVPSAARGVTIGDPSVESPPDQKLLDALENPRDRVWVLKLEQDVIDFVKDARESSFTLPQCHSFYRLLAHKMADYYMLGHFIDETTAAVRLYKTPNCRIPPPLTGITAPSTAASTPPPTAPAMKILRRGEGPAIAHDSNVLPKSGSEDGESGDEKKPKAPISREEREARYEAARLRIMGSAKPSELPELPKDKQDSRPGSVAEKKNKKKARADDDDDGFEARSAYSNYYTPAFGSEDVRTPSYGMNDNPESAANPYANAYAQQQHGPPYPATSVSAYGNGGYSNQQTYQNVDQTRAWVSQNGIYDLVTGFPQMTIQNSVPAQSPAIPYGHSYPQDYNQQYYGPQQGWQQQNYPVSAQTPQSGYGHPPSFRAPHQMGDQPYAFGQLPSQAFPGRPANTNEHPLPGSYKGKNFNPQSQTFVPGDADGRSFSPHGPINAPGSHNQAFQAQPPMRSPRHRSTQSPTSSSFGSPHQNHAQTPPSRALSQALTHPLPQGPVFPHQSSPNVPLPHKPGATQQYPAFQPVMSAPSTNAQGQSLLAKWGTPASLPAKPPPSTEHFDSTKLPQVQRQPYTSAAAVARQPGSFPQYAGMPPAHIVNSAGASKR